MEPVPFKLEVDKSIDNAVTESCAFRHHIVTEWLPLWLLKKQKQVRIRRYVKNVFPSH